MNGLDGFSSLVPVIHRRASGKSGFAAQPVNFAVQPGGQSVSSRMSAQLSNNTFIMPSLPDYRCVFIYVLMVSHH